MTTRRKDFNRYVGLLGVTPTKPGIAALTRLVQAHMVRVPFENISKLYYWKTTGFNGLVDLDQYLDGIERFHFGGTCYPNNYHLHQLLKYLGYDVVLCGADMSKPDVHIVNIVRVEGREFIVDVGYAAPFLAPLPRDLSVEYVVTLGSDRYVLQPRDENDRSRLTLYRDGAPVHGYLINPVPRSIDEFAEVIAGSFRPDATFMNAVLLVRFGPGYSSIVHNMSYIELKGESSVVRSLGCVDELVSVIYDTFGIPPEIVRIAVEGLSMQMSGWG
jgi:N-hydroxyarylamine O-acetyltransferase